MCITGDVRKVTLKMSGEEVRGSSPTVREGVCGRVLDALT